MAAHEGDAAYGVPQRWLAEVLLAVEDEFMARDVHAVSALEVNEVQQDFAVFNALFLMVPSNLDGGEMQQGVAFNACGSSVSRSRATWWPRGRRSRTRSSWRASLFAALRRGHPESAWAQRSLRTWRLAARLLVDCRLPEEGVPTGPAQEATGAAAWLPFPAVPAALAAPRSWRHRLFGVGAC